MKEGKKKDNIIDRAKSNVKKIEKNKRLRAF